MSGILRPIAVAPLKHIYKMLSSREYFTHSILSTKLKNFPRYQDCQVKVNNYNLIIPDARSFLPSYQEIFVDRIYEFKAKDAVPKILDIGANIGLSVLFFKHLYPQAQITAFEADPKIFSYLKHNVYGNGYSDVKLLDSAVWHENTTLKFVSEGADAGHVASGELPNAPSDSQVTSFNSTLEIEAVDIAEILQRDRFEFIKIDIEGAEEFVVPRAQNFLEHTHFFFIEYHSRVGQKQCLDKILHVLSEANFRIHILNVMKKSYAPFVDLPTFAGFDLQLNIFAWKDK